MTHPGAGVGLAAWNSPCSSPAKRTTIHSSTSALAIAPNASDIKAEAGDTPQPGFAGEEEAVSVNDTGDLLIHLVEMARLLSGGSRLIREELRDVSTQLLAFDIQNQHNWRQVMTAIQVLASGGAADDLSQLVFTSSRCTHT